MAWTRRCWARADVEVLKGAGHAIADVFTWKGLAVAAASVAIVTVAPVALYGLLALGAVFSVYTIGKAVVNGRAAYKAGDSKAFYGASQEMGRGVLGLGLTILGARHLPTNLRPHLPRTGGEWKALCTPLLIEDILAGEILWGATKGVFAGSAVLLVAAAFRLAVFPQALLVLPVSAVAGVMFAAFGLLFAALSPYIDSLNLPMFLFVNPMFLFSGTFFPLDGMPRWLRMLSWVLPLTHVVRLTRAATFGILTADLWVSFAYVSLLAVGVSWIAMAKMKRRLIK